MKFFLYHPVHFEEWDYRNVDTGIGGSETHQIEMAWRLARRGHEVISYAPLPKDCIKQWRGTHWKHLDEVNFSQEGLWIIYRSPETMDKIEKKPNQQFWLLCQDEWYPSMTEERAAKFDKILPLCQTHGRYLIKKHPYLANKIWVTSNGIRMDLIREVEKEDVPERNPKRLMYASSPDRGLKYLLQSFRKAREIVRDLELYIFYGFDNIDKLINYNKKYSFYKELKDEILELAKQDGVFLKGRIPQRELYQEWLKTGIWCYQTNFSETSCITSMEAQALGAIPITNPYWALAENVMNGIFIDGDAYNDRLIQSRYAGEIVRLALDTQLQDRIRPQMMNDARCRFNWERFVDQWENELLGICHPYRHTQYNFQHKYAQGRILNIGCDIDISDFKSRNAVNLDLLKESPIMKIPTKADIMADARNLPDTLYNKFDSVIIGDLLEHLRDEDAIKVLVNAKKALYNGGIIILTCPDDNRKYEKQHKGEINAYAENENSFHTSLSKNRIEQWIKDANLSIQNFQLIDYTNCEGYGYVIK